MVKRVMCAGVYPCYNTEGEYEWAESSECEHGEEWDGNVEGYVSNLDIDWDETTILSQWKGAIRNVKEGAVVIGDPEGTPREMYWCEEV